MTLKNHKYLNYRGLSRIYTRKKIKKGDAD